MDEPQTEPTPKPDATDDEPSQSPAGSTITPDETVAPVEKNDEITPAPAPVVNNGTPKKTRHGFIYLLVVIIVLAAGGFIYARHHNDQAKASTAAAAPVPIQHLSVGINEGDIGSLYPNADDTAAGSLVQAQIFDGLVEYENQNQVVPDLATGWTTPTNDTWIFTIRKGVKFHDGHTLTPTDVKYTLDFLVQQNNSYDQTFVDTIKSVDLVGTDQVKITTTQPDPALLNKLAYAYILDQNLPKGDEPSQAGTGPYEVKLGTTPTNKHIDLVAFNGYHGGTVYTKALSLTDVAGQTSLVAGFKNHTYNLIGEVPYNETNVPGATQFVESDNSVDFMAFNTTSGLLSNKLVREAIRYAVSPADIAKADGHKITPISQLIPSSIPGYNPAITPYKQNVAKAKQLLAQAGYPSGLTLKISDGNVPETPGTIELVKELEQIGITTTTDNYPDFNSFINDFLAGNGQIFFLAYSSDTLDGVDIMQSTINQANYNNPAFYNVVNQASTTIDPATRIGLLQKASSMVDQDVAAVPLSYRDNLWLMDKPYSIKQDLNGSYISVYFYKVHQ